MPDFYVSQNGVGDGFSVGNPKAIADLAFADWDQLIAGTDTMYFIGDFVVRLGTNTGANGAAGVYQELDCERYNARFIVPETETNAMAFQNAITYQRIIGGYFEGGATASVDFFKSSFCQLLDADVFHPTKIAIRVRLSDNLDDTDVLIQNCDVNSDEVGGTAIRFSMDEVQGATNTFKDCSVLDCRLNAKITFSPGSIEQSIHVDNRRPSGWRIQRNTFKDALFNVIQVGFSAPPPAPVSIISDNRLIMNGTAGPLVNNVQTNSDFGLVIEDNHITDVLNPGASGDGDGIMLDWDQDRGSYSVGVVMRRNRVFRARSNPSAAGMGNFGARDSKVCCNLSVDCVSGFSVAEAVSGQAFLMSGSEVTAGNPTVIEYTPTFDGLKTREVFVGDNVALNIINNQPDLNGNRYDVTDTTRNPFTFTIDVDTTVAGTGGSARRTRRNKNNIFANLTSVKCDHGFRQRFGAFGAHVFNSIFANNIYGISSNTTNDGEIGTDATNCFWANSLNNIVEDTTDIPIDDTSIIADPMFVDSDNDNYNLREGSPCIGIGIKWWGNDPRPQSLSGEPLPDTQIDIGAYQSTWDPNHPVNL